MCTRYKLHLAPRGMAGSGRDSGPACPAPDRLGRQQPHKARSGDPGSDDGCRLSVISSCLYLPQRSRQPILLAWRSDDPARTRPPPIDAWQRHCHDDAAVETFFKTIKASGSGAAHGHLAAGLKRPASNRSTASITCIVGIQHWQAKAPWLSKAKGLDEPAERHRDVSVSKMVCPNHACGRDKWHFDTRPQEIRMSRPANLAPLGSPRPLARQATRVAQM